MALIIIIFMIVSIIYVLNTKPKELREDYGLKLDYNKYAKLNNFICSNKVLIVIIFLLGYAIISVFSRIHQKHEEQMITKNQMRETENNYPNKDEIQNDNNVKYEVVKRWSIPSGGSGKLVLVSPSQFNESDLIALGGKLKNDAKNEKFSIVFVYDNRDAINLRDRYTSMQTTAKEDQFYEKHLIAQYNKNTSTGFHEYKIYLNGSMSDDYKTFQF